jgi:hypothetical protein
LRPLSRFIVFSIIAALVGGISVARGTDEIILEGCGVAGLVVGRSTADELQRIFGRSDEVIAIGSVGRNFSYLDWA